MEERSSIAIYIDDEKTPVGNFEAPVHFQLDTRKLSDGDHRLKIVSRDPSGKEGMRFVNFTVRNGPAIEVNGIADNSVIDGVVPVIINAYGKGDQKKFLIAGSETPTTIPSWGWAGVLLFVGWAIYYIITSLA
jgi:hypothetical protein